MPHCAEADFCPPAPEPPPHRPGFVELLRTVRRNPLECWSSDFFEERISRVRLPFADTLLVHDPAGIKRVLMDNEANYRKDSIQRRILSSGLSEGLLSSEGERWATQRRTIAPIFARRAVASFEPAMMEAANGLVARWKKMETDATVDIVAEMTFVTLRVLALTIFSDGIGGNLDDFRKAMNAYFGVIGRISALDLLGVPKFVPRPGYRRLRRTMTYFESVIDAIIDLKRERLSAHSQDKHPNDLATLLLRSLDPSTGQKLSPMEVRSNVLTFLSAGHETTANTLAWSLFLLSQAPAWRRRVEEEARCELAKPIEGLADRLVVTKAIIEEALRLYPPIAALSRAAIAADKLGELTVKPGSLIVISPYVLHRHRLLWTKPNVFDPSRFLPGARADIPRFAYLPFGIGPRTCIGSSFALQEAAVVLAVLTHNFDIRLAPGAEVWPIQRITLRPANQLPMTIRPKRLAD